MQSIQVEDTCMVALATAYNARESEGGATKQELLQFVEEVSLSVYMLKDLKLFVRGSISFMFRFNFNKMTKYLNRLVSACIM